MDSLAAEAFLNATHRVCGLQMFPLSLGHAFSLEAISSPFYHGQLGTEADLRLAAWICSRPGLTLPDMNSWACRLWKLRRLKFQNEVARWKTYVADFCAPPQMWAKAAKPGESRAEPSRIPNSITTVVRLMRLGMSEPQAWATPVGVASWYEAAYFEAECGSNLEIVTDAERIAILKSKAKRRAA